MCKGNVPRSCAAGAFLAAASCQENDGNDLQGKCHPLQAMVPARCPGSISRRTCRPRR